MIDLYIINITLLRFVSQKIWGSFLRIHTIEQKHQSKRTYYHGEYECELRGYPAISQIQFLKLDYSFGSVLSCVQRTKSIC